jgi:hypothetical protein
VEDVRVLEVNDRIAVGVCGRKPRIAYRFATVPQFAIAGESLGGHTLGRQRGEVPVEKRDGLSVGQPVAHVLVCQNLRAIGAQARIAARVIVVPVSVDQAGDPAFAYFAGRSEDALRRLRNPAVDQQQPVGPFQDGDVSACARQQVEVVGESLTEMLSWAVSRGATLIPWRKKRRQRGERFGVASPQGSRYWSRAWYAKSVFAHALKRGVPIGRHAPHPSVWVPASLTETISHERRGPFP